MTTFIDTHAHIYGEDFIADLDEVILRARQAGAAKVFLPATDLTSTDEVVQVSQRFPDFCYPMVGLHPEDLPDDVDGVLATMEQRLQGRHPFIAIGEVGLDYYWDASRAADQRHAFDVQIGWSLRYGLPLMIHSRAAHADLLACLSPYGTDRLCGVFHCFSGTADEVRDLLAFPRFALGIGGIVTFKKSKLPDVLREAVPLDRIVLETDAPYMAPVPHRGQRNEPAFVSFVAARLAEIYETTPDEVCRITSDTARRLFPKAW